MLAASGTLGQVWRVPKPVVYRSLQRLEQWGLCGRPEWRPPARARSGSLVDATPAGREAASAWLARPASRTRDVRSELLAKLALLDRAGTDPRPLLDAQREQLVPVAAALQERLSGAEGFERTITAWRWENVSATLRFLDVLTAQPVG